MPPSKHLLDLSTLEPERPTIAVDGISYEMAVREDFGLLEQARYNRLQREADAIRDKGDDAAEDDALQMAGILDQIVALLVPHLPTDLRAKLRDQQKWSILAAFGKAAEERNPQQTATNPQPLPPTTTGEKSSPDSSASTADIPPTGSP